MREVGRSVGMKRGEHERNPPERVPVAIGILELRDEAIEFGAAERELRKKEKADLDVVVRRQLTDVRERFTERVAEDHALTNVAVETRTLRPRAEATRFHDLELIAAIYAHRFARPRIHVWHRSMFAVVGKPFERGRYEDLREKPRLSHSFDATAAREVTLDSVPFGRMRVAYREMGSGPPLLLVHGLMTTSYSWRYVYAPLAKKYRVIAPDLPGAGASDKPLDREYSLEALATWLGEFQNALGIRGARAIGNSLGGLICMRLALDDAGAFSKLVNVHSPFFPEARYHALHAAIRIPGIRPALVHFIRGRALPWVHRNVHYWDESLKSLEEAHAYGDPLAAIGGAEAFVHFLSDTLTPRAVSRIAREIESRHARSAPFPIPLLLIYARQDPMVSPKNGERLAQLISSAKMVWLDQSSHFSHVDTPDLFVKEARDFLD